MSMQQYTSTVARLARAGVKDPTAQIIFLAEEIERYREKIYGLEDHIKKLTEAPPKKLRRHTHLDRPYIELRPTCSECGAPLQERVTADYELIERQNFISHELRITPAECPDCGAVFEYVVLQGNPPGKEKA